MFRKGGGVWVEDMSEMRLMYSMNQDNQIRNETERKRGAQGLRLQVKTSNGLVGSAMGF